MRLSTESIQVRLTFDSSQLKDHLVLNFILFLKTVDTEAKQFLLTGAEGFVGRPLPAASHPDLNGK